MKHTPEGSAFTDLILEIFRFNGLLLAAGDRLTKPSGLTSARWQVMGAVEIAGRPLTVAQIGRRMGCSRQAVQRVANDLSRLEFTKFETNPDHARAKLVALTRKGRKALDHIHGLQTDWANAIADGIAADKITDAVTLMRDLRMQCERIESAPTE